MAIPRMAYKMLEAVLGEEDVSEDPAVTYAYSINFPHDIMLDYFPPVNIQAIVLPESTEEVQAVVRICNEYKITYVPIGSHLGPWCTGGALIIDPKKMNKFWIDEKNRYAVVEPYTTHVQVQTEAMKKGLTNNIPTAGAHCSALCNFLLYGSTLTSHSMGLNGRNVLGMEWVLPDGDILRMGSLGSGGGWFCGDGPGPSLRSLLRGVTGSMGGLGVVTKVAIKLFAYAGPRIFPLIGETPIYTAEFPEDKIKLYAITFPSWDRMADFTYEIGNAEVGMAVHRCPPGGARMAARCNEDAYDMMRTGFFDELGTYPKGSLVVVLQDGPGCSMEYQGKVLRQIMAETEGEFPSDEVMHFVRRTLTPEIVRAYRCQAWTFMTGRYHGVKNLWDSVDSALAYGASGLEMKKEFIEAGALMNDGADHCWMCSIDFSHFGLEEQEFIYDPVKPGSAKAAQDMSMKALEQQLLVDKMPEALIAGDLGNKAFGPMLGNLHIWTMKIKKAFDPNVLSNPAWYITPEEDKI